MGPERDGVWRETGIVARLPENGPELRWKTEIGAGYAGPAVVGDRVFVADRILKPDAANPDETPVVWLDGSTMNYASIGVGIYSGADGTQVHALEVSDFAGDGVTIQSADWVTVSRSVIADNGGNGVRSDEWTDGTMLTGNHIGTDATGADRGNTGYGVVFLGDFGFLGLPGDGNVIGWNRFGVSIATTAGASELYGNYIGTNAAGDALPNDYDALVISGDFTYVGGGTSESANTIGHARTAITVYPNANGTRILGNFVGTNAAGDDLGNTSNGITIRGSNTVVGSASTLDPGSANAIANSASGVYVASTNALNNSIRGKR